MKHLTYILLLLAGVMPWISCSDSDILPMGSGDAVEMTDIAPRLSRATVALLADYVGKAEFADQDRIVLTTVRRTEQPIDQFNYTGLEYVCASTTTSGGLTSIGWTRDADKGNNMAGSSEDHPDRIYWSDAVKPHTFIGYCKPQQGGGLDFDWTMCTVNTLDTYFGSIGNPTDGGNSIDFRSSYDSEGKETVSGNVELCKNDILLTHSTTITANDAIAQLQFHHGLAQARVIVSISDFAAGGGDDTISTVSDMVLKDMATMYKWEGQSAKTEPLLEAEQSQLNGIYSRGTVPSYNQTKDLLLWIPNPAGVGKKANKTFTFYGLAVPTIAEGSQTVHFTFKVTYPDPMQPTVMKTEDYAASIANIRFDAGKCTTLNIALNHRNEKMTVGVEYDEWEFIDTPDQGALKKHSTFLDTAVRDSVTIFGDANANIDDATWLYVDPTTKELRDVYGHRGTPTDPFVISTARQLLSFAYEVTGAYDKSGKQRPAVTYKHIVTGEEVRFSAGDGFDFAGYYIKLDADITMQPTSKIMHDSGGFYTGSGDSRKDAIGVTWPGIGDATHEFNGVFLGGSRRINRLYGNHFFHTLGLTAVVDKLNFDDVLELLGCGVVAHENNGLVCSCYLDGDVTETNTATTHTGSIVGTNNSFIVACSHVGKVTGYGKVGGIVGFNNGTVMVCYHSGNVVTKTAAGSGGEAHPTVGAYGTKANGHNESIMFSCYYDSRVFTGTPVLTEGKLGFPVTTAVMQSRNFVDGPNTYTFDSQGACTVTDKTIKDVLSEVLTQAGITPDMDEDQTDEKNITAMMKQLINHDRGIDHEAGETDLNKILTFKLYEYHFSLNAALRVFREWTHAMPEREEVTTNCHTFSPQQIQFLKAHYNGSHVYKYNPASYPKTQ